MANPDHLGIILQGVKVWNSWRQENLSVVPDLSAVDFSGHKLCAANFHGTNFKQTNFKNADLSGADCSKSNFLAANLTGSYLYKANLSSCNFLAADLSNADIHRVNLERANLEKANLQRSSLRMSNLGGTNLSRSYLQRTEMLRANLSNANLTGAFLSGADLRGANLDNSNLFRADLRMASVRGASLKNANLKEADLSRADLTETDLQSSDLSGSNLISSILVKTNLFGANISHSNVYGISAWDLNLVGTEQNNLVITIPEEPTITVDNLEVAQFIYLLLNNSKIREVIDTITSKVVLILGSFSILRKPALDGIKDELRKQNYLPILFDFDKPSNRDITETVSTLAHLARFIIADLTDAASVPHELMRIIPALPSVPVKPIILGNQSPYSMFEHFINFPWVMEALIYNDTNELLSFFDERVIQEAELKVEELRLS